MASEFYAESSREIGVTLTPSGVNGLLQVFIDGEKIYDKSLLPDNRHPDLPLIKQFRAICRKKIQAYDRAKAAARR